MRSVMWFRRDLRVADHPALSTASQDGPIVGLFVVDPTFATAGTARQAQLGRALRSLDRAMHGQLVIRHGHPAEVVSRVAAEANCSTVFVTRDAGPYGRRRDAAVARRLAESGRRLRGIGSNYAVAPGTVTRPDGDAYSVFTPFRRAWRNQGWSAPIDPPEVDWHTLASEGAPPDPTERWGAVPPVSEGDAHQRWADFVSSALSVYAAHRNLPAVDGTSRLSSALRWGTLHPRQLLADLHDGPDHDAFASELCWREFYADVLLRVPAAASESLDRRTSRVPVDRDRDARRRFTRWKDGQTGFPLVDAGMRQLAATGWMHNRVRMVTASFLVKDLHLPWQWGARHFLDHLVDGDLASNSLGWQWVAGTGTDAAPYHRILNPSLHIERFDPDGEYVKEWVRELADATTRQLTDPRRPVISGYPSPMLDHATERQEALARFRFAQTVES